MKTYRDAFDSFDSFSGGGSSIAPGKTSTSARLGRVRDGNGVAADADAAVARAGGAGAPLPDELRSRFEGSLGADLSSVRVHTDEASADAAHAVGARAYAMGQDIHFGAGQYDPTSSAGQILIAHEVAHTVQQSGGAPHRQHKLEVSTPGDAAEVEADRAAAAMVTGAPTRVTQAGGLARAGLPVFRDVETAELQEAGAAMYERSKGVKLRLGLDFVTRDVSDSEAIIADIDKHLPMCREAEKEEPDAIAMYAASDTNVATKTALQIFGDKLNITAMDSTSFAVQYREAMADYNRIEKMAMTYTEAMGAEGGMEVVGEAMAATPGAALDDDQAGLERFRRLRATLNGCAKKMDTKMTAFRGASQSLIGSLYSAKAKAAKVKGAGARSKLQSLRAEIDGAAKNVGLCVKLASAASGLAGGGGATAALAKPKESGGSVDVEGSRSGLRPGSTVLTPAEQDRVVVARALGKDAMGLVGATGVELSPDKLAESLVKAIGEYANKEKLAALATEITNEAAKETEFDAAAEANQMSGYQTAMEAAAKDYLELIDTYKDAKRELADAAQKLIDKLNKKGTTGKTQAKGVLFLSESDRFLAQARLAIASGEHQQANLKSAVEDRKGLRGTDTMLGDDKNRATRRYWRCEKRSNGDGLFDDTVYSFSPVSVTFSGGTKSFMGGSNDIDQGGGGSVEGVGGAGDVIREQINNLKTMQTKVKAFQASAQSMLGLDGPGADS